MRTETLLRRWAALLVAVLHTAPGAAQQRADARSEGRTTTDVDFSADRVDLSAEPEEIELSGNVEIRASRYRLSGDDLSLRRTPRGVRVDGSGRVAFCPCEHAPVTLGFRSALIAPPTDLILKHPTVRVGNVPVFWMPYLWLRSPRRMGLLPPTLRWSQQDGFFAATGIHVPLQRGGAMDWRVGGYVRGGGQIDVTAATARTATHVQWDYLESSSVTVAMLGATEPLGSSAVAWQVDALRGERAVRGPTDVADISKPYDRAAVSALTSGDAWTLAIGGRGDVPRATPIEELGAWGPTAGVSWQRGLGRRSLFTGDIRTRTAASAGRAAMTSLVGDMGVGTYGRLGPVAVASHLRTRGLVAMTDDLEQQAVAAGGQAELSVPLVRSFGTGRDRLNHWVEPFVDGGVGAGGESTALVLPWFYPEGAFFHAASGVRTNLGRLSRRSGVSLEGRYGWVGTASESDDFASWRVLAGGRWVGIDAEGILDIDAAAVAARSIVRVGRLDSLNAALRADGQVRTVSTLGRLVNEGGWDAPMRLWFDRSGWTLSPSVSVPWVSWLATSADIVYDLTERGWISARGAIAYRHPCGCFALVSWAGHRLGRDGVDAWVSVDLMPR